jgi:hypothetical protein
MCARFCFIPTPRVLPRMQMRWSLTEIFPASTIRGSSARRHASGFTRTFVALTDGRGFGIESTADVLLTKPSTRTSCASHFYGICRKNKEPTSGLEPLSCSIGLVRQRKIWRHRSPLSHATLNLDPPVVGLCDGLNDGESQSSAAPLGVRNSKVAGLRHQVRIHVAPYPPAPRQPAYGLPL